VSDAIIHAPQMNTAIPIVYAIPTSWPMRFALPRNIWPGWEFTAPAEVLIEHDDEGSYIVSEDRTVIYGVGDTPDEAIRDYLIALVEYEQIHEQEAQAGDPKAQKQLELLGRYFRPARGTTPDEVRFFPNSTPQQRASLVRALLARTASHSDLFLPRQEGECGIGKQDRQTTARP
jgi:hypothetical protein